MNVLDQFGLCICGAGDQNRAGVRDGLDDSLKILMIRRGMSAADAIGLMMNVLGRTLRMHDKAFDVRRAEMKNARLSVIDPDDGMIVMAGHVFGSFDCCSKRERASIKCLYLPVCRRWHLIHLNSLPKMAD